MDLPIFIAKRIFWDTRLEDIDLQAHKNSGKGWRKINFIENG